MCQVLCKIKKVVDLSIIYYYDIGIESILVCEIKVNKLNAMEIENILDTFIPIIAEPKDEEFFRFAIGEKLAACTSSEAVVFVNKLLGKGTRR